ncbi:MAG: hypothetical protein ACRET2_05305 [Steroidobacteraceae bacterium]
MDEPLRDGQESQSERIPSGQKVTARCPACRDAGRQPDYQASWTTVERELAIARNTRCERRTITIG